MDEKTLSIIEFANAAGISPQALYKSVRNPNSKIISYVVVEGNKHRIRVSALKEVYKVEYNPTTENETPQPQNETPNQPKPTPTPENETTETNVGFTDETPNETPTEENQPKIKPYEGELIEVLRGQIAHLLAEIEKHELREIKWEEKETEWKIKEAELIKEFSAKEAELRKEIKEKELEIQRLNSKIESTSEKNGDIAAQALQMLHDKNFIENLEKAQKIKQEEAAAQAEEEPKVIEDKAAEPQIQLIPQKSIMRKFIDLFKM